MLFFQYLILFYSLKFRDDPKFTHLSPPFFAYWIFFVHLETAGAKNKLLNL